VAPSWFLFFSYHNDARSNKNKNLHHSHVINGRKEIFPYFRFVFLNMPIITITRREGARCCFKSMPEATPACSFSQNDWIISINIIASYAQGCSLIDRAIRIAEYFIEICRQDNTGKHNKTEGQELISKHD